MIIKTSGFQVGSQFFATLERAQVESLNQLFLDEDPATQSGSVESPNWSTNEISNFILENRDKIIDILTTTEKSRPKARKFNGAVKTRKPKRHVAEQFPLPGITDPAKVA